MSYTISFGNIVEFDGDAIINSLGVQGRVYGQLCRNIVDAMEDENIKNYIDSLKNNKIGNIFLTESGKLPCKKIMHVVTPLKHLDDDKNTRLKKVYKDIINTSIKEGFQTIAFPFIGTGANGYSEKEVYAIMLEVCDELSALEEKEDRDILTITIIGYLKPQKLKIEKSENRVNLIEKEEKYLRKINCEESYDGEYQPYLKTVSSKSTSNNTRMKDKFKKIRKCHDAMNELDYNNLFVNGSSYKDCPFDFVTDYLNETGDGEITLTRNGMDRRRKNKFKERTSITKRELYAIAILAKMNFSTLVQFMIECGYSFQPDEPLDIFVIDYYHKDYCKEDSIFTFNQLCHDKTKINLIEGITYSKKKKENIKDEK